jgi:hypothetical protein
MRARYGGAAVALLAVLALVTLWNAARYPPGLGYDAVDHIAYAEELVEHGRLPDERGEYYTPPLFYAVAGTLIEAGEAVGLGDPLRLVQLFNALVAVATGVLLLELARTIWPGRRWLGTLALGLFALGPLVPKAAAMVHPETLSLFFSTLALWLAARLLVERSYRTRDAVLVGLALGAGQLVRAWSLWTFAVVLLALGAAALGDRARRRAVLRAGVVVLAATALVAGPWYAYQAARYSNPVFDRPQEATPLWKRRGPAFYLDPGLPHVITDPARPEFPNRFWPMTYAEAWGDYYGVFGWNNAETRRPTTSQHRELALQSVVGLLPTGLALAGWVALLACTLRSGRWRRHPERLLVGLLPLAGLAGLGYFAVSYPTVDGDVIKATYMLTTAPAWALGFGLAATWVGRRWPRLVVPLAVVLGVSALVSVRYALYGSGVGGLL